MPTQTRYYAAIAVGAVATGATSIEMMYSGFPRSTFTLLVLLGCLLAYFSAMQAHGGNSTSGTVFGFGIGVALGPFVTIPVGLLELVMTPVFMEAYRQAIADMGGPMGAAAHVIAYIVAVIIIIPGACFLFIMWASEPQDPNHNAS